MLGAERSLGGSLGSVMFKKEVRPGLRAQATDRANGGERLRMQNLAMQNLASTHASCIMNNLFQLFLESMIRGDWHE